MTGSPEWTEAERRPAAAGAQTDFVGIAIHCAQTPAALRRQRERQRRRRCPTSRGGYTGYQALFGAKYVNPAITGGDACVNDTAGAPITDPFGNCGFPGFDGMLAKNTLGYVAQMQESGVPVTYAYISDAHDNHGPLATLTRLRAGRGRLQAAAEGLRRRVRGVLPAARDTTGSTSATRCSSSRSTRATTSPAAPARPARRHPGLQRTRRARTPTSTLPVEPDRRGQRQHQGALLPAGERQPSRSTSTTPRRSTSTGSPGRDRPGRAQARARRRGLKAIDPYAGGADTCRSPSMADPVEEQALHMVNTRSEADADVHHVRQRRLLLPRPTLDHLRRRPSASTRRSPGTTATSRTEIGNTWLGLVGPGVKHTAASTRRPGPTTRTSGRRCWPSSA